MNKKTLLLALIVTGAIGAAGYGVYRLGLNRGMQRTAASPAASPQAAAQKP